MQRSWIIVYNWSKVRRESKIIRQRSQSLEYIRKSKRVWNDKELSYFNHRKFLSELA